MHYTTFFQKLADMFERLSEELPSYARFTKHVRARLEGRVTLLNLLALIYSDILGICQRVVKIFATKGPGIRHKLNVINDILWKPFDHWFSDILDRLARHRSLLEFELTLLGDEVSAAHYAIVEEELGKAKEFRALQTARAEKKDEQRHEEGARLFKEQVRTIKNWIHAPDYTALPRREAAETVDGTFQWFKTHPKYSAWKRMNEHSCTTTQAKDAASVLWVQGPPGYGKTALSNVVIDDLKSETREAGIGGYVAYFHFDKLSQDCKEPQHALRAILNQAIHARQDCENAVDALTLLMDVEGSGQRIASESDISMSLSLLLHKSAHWTILLDGVDECSDTTRLFQALSATLGIATVKLIFFSRPEIAVPPVWRKTATICRLGRQENLDCIQKFVRPRIDQMEESHLLPSGVSTQDLASIISERANSLFLWAKLMLIYLECPALSPRLRLQTIREHNLIEGLDEMYRRILDLISGKLRPQREAAYRTFQWLVAAHRPLHFRELQTALAIRIGQVTDPEDCISDFQQSLVTICLSLVDVLTDGTVQFIHLSVQEFLSQKSFPPEAVTPGPFHIDLSEAHLLVTSSCLSYLQNDVPRKPLSGSSKILPSKSRVQAELPLLRYAVDWWKNGVAGFSALRSNTRSSFPLIPNTFLPLVQQFLEAKALVTVWVEALWLLSKSPNLNLLSIEMDAYAKEVSSLVSKGPIENPSFVKRLWMASESIAELSLDLNYLQDQWGKLLRANPTEVWEPSINAFHSSRYLIKTDVSKIAWSAATRAQVSDDGDSTTLQDHTCLDHTNLEHSTNQMVLLSQVSTDGHFLGSIRLTPPS